MLSPSAFSLCLMIICSGSLSLAAAAYDCQAISDRATRNGTKVMVIGVEGLAQYNDAYVQQLEADNETVKAGGKPDIPNTSYAPTGLVGQSGVTRGLLRPLLRRYGTKIEPLVIGEEDVKRGSSTIVQKCAETWMKVRGRKLIIIGHSYGGPAALDLAKNLGDSGVNIDALYTVDPVQRPGPAMSAPSNVSYLANYWQNSLPRPGQSLAFAQEDQLLSSLPGFDVGHMNITGHPTVVRAVEGRLDSLLADSPTAGKSKKASTKTVSTPAKSDALPEGIR